MVGLALASAAGACGGDGDGDDQGPFVPSATCDVGWQTRTIEVDGVPRVYELYLPEAQGESPLVLLFHGLGGSAATVRAATGMDGQAESRGLILAVPTGLPSELDSRPSWNAGACCSFADPGPDDVAFSREIAADISSLGCVRASSTTAMGLSNGGMMAYRLACEAADLVDSVAIGIGTLTLSSCTLDSPVDTVHIHGTADTVVATDGTLGGELAATPTADAVAMLAAENQCTSSREENRGNAVCTVYEGCRAATEYCLVSDMGHVWPNEVTAGFDGTSYMLDVILNQP